MNPNVLTAAISAGAAVVPAIVALIVNSRGFSLLDSRISDTNRRIDELRNDTNRRIDDLRNDTNRRLSTIEGDLKEFFKVQAEHDKRIQRLEDNQ